MRGGPAHGFIFLISLETPFKHGDEMGATSRDISARRNAFACDYSDLTLGQLKAGATALGLDTAGGVGSSPVGRQNEVGQVVVVGASLRTLSLPRVTNGELSNRS